MSALRKLSALSSADRRVLASSTLLLAAVRLLLWVLPSRVILSAARSLVAVPERASAGRPRLDRIVWAIGAASERIPHASCLTQAIAAQILLRRHGYGSRLCLGVAPDGRGGFRAHAWVERDGSILIGGEESRALVRLTLPARRSSTLQAP
jgi:hypothetical protein